MVNILNEQLELYVKLEEKLMFYIIIFTLIDIANMFLNPTIFSDNKPSEHVKVPATLQVPQDKNQEEVNILHDATFSKDMDDHITLGLPKI
jgi:hypothetical protein